MRIDVDYFLLLKTGLKSMQAQVQLIAGYYISSQVDIKCTCILQVSWNGFELLLLEHGLMYGISGSDQSSLFKEVWCCNEDIN